MVEIIAEGYYYNEVTGNLSDSPLTLWVYADLKDSSKVNVNILTSLAHDRIRALMAKGARFSEAADQAKTEVLSVFKITPNSLNSFSGMDISQMGDSNAVLLACSAILQGSNSVAQLSELLAQLGSDIAVNGQVTYLPNASQLVANSKALDLDSVRQKLSARYASLGVVATIPNFQNFVDSQGVGTVNGGLPTSLSITGPNSIDEGSSAAFGVSLKGALVSGSKTVTLTASDPSRFTVSPATLIFSADNFYTPQTVTVTGVQGQSTATATIVASSSNLDPLSKDVVYKHVFTEQTLPSSDSFGWSSVAFGNGTFVSLAGGNGSSGCCNVAATSPDGVHWTQRTLPSSQTWVSIAFGNGTFVAISATANSSNVAATSSDGITWTQRTLPASMRWTSITFGNGLFVAVAGSGSPGGSAAAYSSDGITWTLRRLPDIQWSSVIWGGGTFVAIGGGPTNIAVTSPDGITWTQRTLPNTNWWSSIAYGNGLFVAIAGNHVSATSPDGKTWTQRTLPLSSSLAAMTFGGGFFLGVSYGANTGSPVLAQMSADGITWTEVAMPTQFWSAVAYGNSTFVAVSASASMAPGVASVFKLFP